MPLGLAFFFLIVFFGAFRAAADWKSEANERIKQIRQRDARIRVVDESGSPIPDATVSVRQTRKAFPFGSAMGATLLRNEQYQEFFKNHFNWAVFENESKWYSNERRRGVENYAAADAIYQWCEDNNISVRGHCIFWEPEKWQTRWLRELNAEEIRAAVERRLESAVTHFRGKFVSWDVDNEMLHGSFFEDHLGADIHPWMYKRAHELDPNASLFVNEFNILSVDQDFSEVQVDEYVEDTRKLLEKGAPIDGIGIQGHIWNEDILAHPEVIKARLDKVAALGRPIWISEFDTADDDENSNADKLELVYRTAYSHPRVEGIMMWVFWSGASWRGPNAGIVKRDWTLNEAGQRFEALMKEWSTDTEGTSDENGLFAFRGFHGDYEATVRAGDRGEAVETFRLEAGEEPQIITVQLKEPAN